MPRGGAGARAEGRAATKSDPLHRSHLTRIISGGQAGVDRAALDEGLNAADRIRGPRIRNRAHPRLHASRSRPCPSGDTIGADDSGRYERTDGRVGFRIVAQGRRATEPSRDGRVLRVGVLSRGPVRQRAVAVSGPSGSPHADHLRGQARSSSCRGRRRAHRGISASPSQFWLSPPGVWRRIPVRRGRWSMLGIWGNPCSPATLWF